MPEVEIPEGEDVYVLISADEDPCVAFGYVRIQGAKGNDRGIPLVGMYRLVWRNDETGHQLPGRAMNPGGEQ